MRIRRLSTTCWRQAEKGNITGFSRKDPSVQAFTDLMNRAIDKPKEQELEVKLAGDWDQRVARLLKAMKDA